MIGDREDFEIQIELIQKIVAKQKSLEQAMEDAIEAVSPGITNEAHTCLKEIDFTEALNQSREWITHVISNETPPKPVFAFYYGMYDTEDEDGQYEWQQMYICGSTHFDADDEGDWACDPGWMPQSRYPLIPAMKRFGELCPHTENQAGYTLASSFVAALAIDHTSIIASKLGFKKYQFGLKQHKEYPIATGHDSGDITLLGYATPSGFRSPV